MRNNQLFNGSLLFFVVIMSGLLFSVNVSSRKGYMIDNPSVMTSMNANSFLMTYLEYVEHHNPGGSGIAFVDLRTPEQFEESHIQSAVNLPLASLFNGDVLKNLRSYDEGLVLYSNAESTSVLAVMMLKSLGVDNVRALAGNYALFAAHISDSPNPALFFHSDEKIRWNFNNFMGAPSSHSPQKNIAEPPAIQGGC